MIYPGLNNYSFVALNEALRIELLRNLLDKGAAAIPQHPTDPYIDPLTDTERDLLNAAMDLGETVGELYDHALAELVEHIQSLCKTVRRYAAPAKDDDYCSRSELLRAVAEAEKIAHGMK